MKIHRESLIQALSAASAINPFAIVMAVVNNRVVIKADNHLEIIVKATEVQEHVPIVLYARVGIFIVFERLCKYLQNIKEPYITIEFEGNAMKLQAGSNKSMLSPDFDNDGSYWCEFPAFDNSDRLFTVSEELFTAMKKASNYTANARYQADVIAITETGVFATDMVTGYYYKQNIECAGGFYIETQFIQPFMLKGATLFKAGDGIIAVNGAVKTFMPKVFDAGYNKTANSRRDYLLAANNQKDFIEADYKDILRSTNIAHVTDAMTTYLVFDESAFCDAHSTDTTCRTNIYSSVETAVEFGIPTSNLLKVLHDLECKIDDQIRIKHRTNAADNGYVVMLSKANSLEMLFTCAGTYKKQLKEVTDKFIEHFAPDVCGGHANPHLYECEDFKTMTEVKRIQNLQKQITQYNELINSYRVQQVNMSYAVGQKNLEKKVQVIYEEITVLADLSELTAKLDKAKEDGNEKRIEQAEKAIAAREKKIAKKREEAEKLTSYFVGFILERSIEEIEAYNADLQIKIDNLQAKAEELKCQL